MYRCALITTLIAAAILFLVITATHSRSLLTPDKSAGTSEATFSSSHTSEIVDPVVPWPVHYGVQQTGAINTVFDCWGHFGNGWGPWHYRVEGWPTGSFETPPGSGVDYLYAGGLWIGGIVDQEALVSTGLDGWTCIGQELRPPTEPYGSIEKIEYPTDYSMRAVFADTGEYDDPWSIREHFPLNLLVVNRSHVWRTEAYEDFVIYDLVISNIGDSWIYSAYVGFYFDADVGLRLDSVSYDMDDLVGSIRDEGIAYIIDNDGDPNGMNWVPDSSARKIFAFKLLESSREIGDTNFNWWTGATYASDDFGPRLRTTPDFTLGYYGTPVCDIDKYAILRRREWDYDQIFTASIPPDDPVWRYPDPVISERITDGWDAKFVMSFGPIHLGPDSSIRIVVAVLTGDNVHSFALNGELHLPDFPNQFLLNLDFDDVLANAAAAAERAAFLIQPEMPPIGLHPALQCWDSVVIEWDPWVFDNITGHQVYISEVSPESLPYPGVAAPWLRPQSTEPAAAIGRESHCALDNLDSSKFYFVTMANRTESGAGQQSQSTIVCQRGEWPGPVPERNVIYYYDGQPPELQWTGLDEWDIDHYCIYRFDSTETLSDLYPRHYATRLPDVYIQPVDSFHFEHMTYYYFAMEPYASVDSGITSFQEPEPVSGSWYVITAVDKNGFESGFSSPVASIEIFRPDRDILLISKWPNLELTKFDTVREFYDGVFAGYDYDIYCANDTLGKYLCDVSDGSCIKWRDWTRFKMVIVDFESYERIFNTEAESDLRRLEQYMATGGKVAYFGDFFGLNEISHRVAVWHEQNDWLVKPYFGIDSIFFYSVMYYFYNGLPRDVDSCFGFSWAEPATGRHILEGFPEIGHDALRDPWTSFVDYYWWDDTPPSVCVFAENDLGEVLYRFRSRDPNLSWLEGRPVGVRTVTEDTETYLFGFHLWYMEQESARLLVEKIFGDSQTDADQIQAELLPQDFALRQNYPNPFNPSTVISFDLPRSAKVTLEIFNILGQRVNTLISARELSAGTHKTEWYSDDAYGNRVSSGIYFFRLSAGEHVATRKMMLIR